MRYMVSTALWDAYQLLAAYVVDDDAREAHPELVERGFTEDWAESIRADLQGPYRKTMLNMILNNPSVDPSGSEAWQLLSTGSCFSGLSVQTLLAASADMHQMIRHFEMGEGEDYEDPAIPLMKLGYSKEVAQMVSACGGLAAWITARSKRLVGKSKVDEDVVEEDNMRFKRAEAFLGVRPWVYDGVVDENMLDPTEDDIQLFTECLNIWDDAPLRGRWV